MHQNVNSNSLTEFRGRICCKFAVERLDHDLATCLVIVRFREVDTTILFNNCNASVVISELKSVLCN